MAEYSKQCGPNAVDEYDKYTVFEKTNDRGRIYKVYTRSHNVTGNGIMTSSNVSSGSYHDDKYYIDEGITELGDGCLSHSSIDYISLPSSLERIGDECFRYSSIEGISLPDGLKEIGEKNFPSTLKVITIPPLVDDFNVNNLEACSELAKIDVSSGNRTYVSYDGMLYSHDMTKILRCPIGKEGTISIAGSVREIGEHCFAGCKKIAKLIIPNTVKIIGDYAFSGIEIDRLTIPNSVSTIGKGCLSEAVIKTELKLPARLDTLPEDTFLKAKYPSFNFLKNLKYIGSHGMDETTTASSLPEVVSLPSVRVIGPYAFCNATKEYHLPSSLENICKGAFSDTEDGLTIRYFSFAPIRLDRDAFEGISPNATLIVPKHCKLIFENAYPWNTFNIKELELDEDYNKEGKVTDELWAKRIQSVHESVRKADLFYLKEIIEGIKDNYLNVDDDATYDEAMELIRYNYSFSLAIVPNLEQEICLNWAFKYKLQFLDSSIGESRGVVTEPSNRQIEQIKIPELPLMPEKDKEKENSKTAEYEVYFSDILKNLQNELTKVRSSLRIAVSWVTNYTLFRQIKELAENGIKVQLITNNDLINNGGYCLNLNELIDAGVDISLVEYPHLLHDKFCIIDDNVVINGSYNWTRFSANNYENIVISRSDEKLANAFKEEFAYLLANAEHKSIKRMPDTVSERPEYDRSAFRQYITEELDAKSHEVSDERERITALHEAAKLNPYYLEKINPAVKSGEMAEKLKVIENSESVVRDIVNLATGSQEQEKTDNSTTNTVKGKDSENAIVYPRSISVGGTAAPIEVSPKLTKEETEKIIDSLKASGLFMAVDVSGSMEQTFSAGHVHNIVTKAVEAALSLSGTKEVSVWSFGNESNFLFNVGIGNISKIKELKCMKEGTNLIKFVEKTSPSMKPNSLIIILTDDDQNSIGKAMTMMKSKTDVFWQVLTYGEHNNITEAIAGVANVSIKSLEDYPSKSDSEITSILLKDYIAWKQN